MRKWASLAVVCLVLTGCPKSDPEADRLVPASGTVTLDGKPIGGVSVHFSPRSGTPGNGAFATTSSDGNYVLTNRGNKPGILAGNYSVSFSKLAMPDGSPIPAGKTAADVEAVEQLPAIYTPQCTAETPSNTATVTDSGGTFNFDLTASGRPG